VNAKAVGLALTLAALPIATTAQTQYVRYAAVKANWFPSVYVHTGGSIDIALEDGDSLNSEAIVADPRWHMTSLTAGPTATPHVILKPSEALSEVQLLTIPGAKHEYHVLLQSGNKETTAYTLVFFQPSVPRRLVALAPASQPRPRPVAVNACAPPLETTYRISGDSRIPIAAVCDDGVRTFVLLRSLRGPAAVPYRVDAGGHQDQIMNPGFTTVADAHGRPVGEWVLDGVFDHIAFVADSSRGQIRKNVDRLIGEP